MKRGRGKAGVAQFLKRHGNGCPLVLVEWVDSSYSLGWLTEADTDEPKLKKCCSVGWLRKQTKEAVILTANMTMEENAHRCCEITIPRCAIQRLRRL